ncbi:MAG: formimidoylglutamase [Burkholderiales bacterium]
MSFDLLPIDPAIWRGRVDATETGDATRWHQHVKPWLRGAPGGVALVGFACDLGVRRNHGRPGAAAGPEAIRRALAGLAWHQPQSVWDAGDVRVDEARDDLEDGQAFLAGTVADLLDEGHRVIALGGGHEIAFGTFAGLARHAGAKGETIGVVNVDAHFDLRAGPRGTSGTPFREIAEHCAASGRPFRYLCLGVNEDANTRALFDTARRLGAEWRLDTDMGFDRHEETRAQLARFLESVDRVHLSLDLDALPAAVAPGVSAPAARGVSLELVEAIVGDVAASGKLRLADIAELNPAFDVDGRTARVAARLVARIARQGA